MAADEQITIKFVPEGDKKLINSFVGLAKAQKKFNGTTQRGARDVGILGDAFSVVRSKMLLFNFAMGLGIRQVVNFAKEASKVNSMERAFNTMAGATEDSNVAFRRLQAATDGTMSKFDLFQQANNAMILGVSKNSEEMAEMFDMAQRLGNALGKDTKMSVESLITGIGRQSRLMLDNIGIVVKTEDAYKSYAKELKKNADQLTDSEKKQAFLNATLESARQKVAGLPPEVFNSQMEFAAFAASSANASAVLGEAFIPTLTFLSKELRLTMDMLDTDKVQRFSAALGIGAAAFVTLKVATSLATFEMRKFTAAMAANPIGLAAVAISAAAFAAMEYFDVFKGGDEDVSGHTTALQDAVQAQQQLSEEQEKGQESLQKKLDLLNATSEIEKMRINLGHKASEAEEELMQKIVAKTEAIKRDKKATELYSKVIEDMADIEGRMSVLRLQKLGASDEEIAMLNEKIRFESELRDMGLSLNDDILIRLDLDREYTQLEQDKINLLVEEHKIRQSLIDLDEKDRKVQAEKIKLGGKTINTIAAIAGMNEKNAKEVAKLQAIASGVNAFAAASDAFAQAAKNPLTIANPMYPNIIYGLTLAQGLAGAVAAHNAASKMEQGGLVGGRRHSQGGTMIEAEQGEFVMSRNAVNAVGVEAMNRINAGGGAGNVNISFAGNVMSQDFIEDEAIPMIKEAIRRGADIGVS
jgi:hypothetical protein